VLDTAKITICISVSARPSHNIQQQGAYRYCTVHTSTDTVRSSVGNNLEGLETYAVHLLVIWFLSTVVIGVIQVQEGGFHPTVFFVQIEDCPAISCLLRSLSTAQAVEAA
jgi:hypothetical protein